MEQELNNTLLKRKKIINISIILLFVFVAIFIVSVICNFKFDNMLSLVIISAIIIATDIYFIISYKSKTLKIIKQGIFSSLITDVFGNATYLPDGMPREKFKESGLYLNYNNYYTSDRIKKGMDELEIANVTATYKKDKDTQDIIAFKGIFAVMKIDDFYKDEIIIKPDYENKLVSTFLDATNKLLGENKNVIRLENPEFEKNFEVYSRDPIKTRQLITVEYMENLVYLKNKLNTTIKIIYFGNKKYIAIWNKRLIDEKDIYKNGIHLDKIKENLKDIFEVIQES